MSYYIRSIITIFFCFLSTTCFASENIFYVLRYDSKSRMSSPQETFSSLKKNYKKINMLIPQGYSIDEMGEVVGKIEPEIFDFAKTHSLKMMPLVVNRQFSKEVAAQFLSDVNAQQKAINALLILCRKNQFYGIQLDFEMVGIENRDRLTQFYTNAANALHKEQYKISFALAPVVVDKPGQSHFLDKIYKNWEGAYDFKKLGEVSDFVSIMAYNQHRGRTTPGPTADWDWSSEAIKYALQSIPANKVSLGIPTFSTYWRTGTDNDQLSGKLMVRKSGVDFNTAMKMIHQHDATILWDKKSKSHFAMYSNNWLHEYIFVEDVASFSAKSSLIQKYKLRGTSIFDLGTEDSNIWKKL